MASHLTTILFVVTTIRKPHIFISQTAKHVFFQKVALQWLSNEWLLMLLMFLHIFIFLEGGGLTEKQVAYHTDSKTKYNLNP